MWAAHKVMIDMETGETLFSDRHWVEGNGDLCKGGNSQEEEKRANDLEAQRNAQSQQMLDLFKQQLGAVNPILDKIIGAGGMLPEQQAAMTSILMNQLPATFNSLEGALSNKLVQRGVTGGANAGSGDIARDYGFLGAAEGNMQQQGLSNIQLAKGQGLEQALGAKLGIGSMFGQQAQGFGQQAVGALGIGQQAGQAADQASTGFWGSLFGALASPFSFSFGGGK